MSDTTPGDPRDPAEAELQDDLRSIRATGEDEWPDADETPAS